VGARGGSTWAGGDYLRGALGWERRANLRTTNKARSHKHTQAQATQPLHRGPSTPIPTAFQQAPLVLGLGVAACRPPVPAVGGVLPRGHCLWRRTRSSRRCCPSTPPHWRRRTSSTDSRHSRSTRGAPTMGVTAPVGRADAVGGPERERPSNVDARRPSGTTATQRERPARQSSSRRTPSG